MIIRKLMVAMLGFVLLSILAGPAEALIIVDEGVGVDPGPMLPHPRPPRVIAPLELLQHQVHVTIHDQVATTTVEQEFYNPSERNLEGTFLFPVPAGGQIDRFTMEVNGQTVAAELLDADKARRIYEDIVRRQRDPALLEYLGRDLFKVRIFPIEGHSNKRVLLKYTQVLTGQGGLVTYTYPLNTEKFTAKPIQTVALKVELDSRQAIKSIYSPSHEVEIKRTDEHHAVIGYEASDLRPDVEFQLVYSVQADGQDIGVDLVTYNDPGDAEGGYFLLLASPGLVADDKVIDKDVVFVLDTSGSMAGEKLDQAKGALRYCVSSLNAGDRFEVVRFSTEAEPLFGALAAATQENRDKALTFVDELTARGGTAIQDALTQAVESRRKAGENPDAAKQRPFTVIFLTDGRPTIGATDEDQIAAQVARQSDGKVRVFCFGIGSDVNTHLLDKITEQTRAFSQYVLPKEDIEVKVSSFFARISNPVLADLQLSVDGPVKLAKMYPRPLPDLFEGDQLIVFGRYEGSGAATLLLQGAARGKVHAFERQVRFDAAGKTHEFIPRLWAARRIGYLLDEIRLHGESAELRDEVTQLARRYGIVTPYTAYLIMEDEDARNVPMAQRAMPGMRANAPARDASERLYYRMRDDKSGLGAVAGTASNQALKQANTPAAPMDATLFAANDAEAAQVPQQSVKLVQNRCFYQNGSQWTEAGVSDRKDARIVRIQFASDEYFDLINKHPDTANVLCVGQNVQLVVDDTVYQIEDDGAAQ